MLEINSASIIIKAMRAEPSKKKWVELIDGMI